MSLDETPTVSSMAAGAPGELLQQARERAGMSRDDIAAKLKLSPRQIAAIESGDWSALPERTFTRGFMRSYARLVGVDPDVLGLDRSQPQAASELRPTPEAMGEIAHDGHGESGGGLFSGKRLLVPILLMLVLGCGAAWLQWGHLIGMPGTAPLGNTAAGLKAAVAARSEQANAEAAASSRPASAAPSDASANPSAASAPTVTGNPAVASSPAPEAATAATLTTPPPAKPADAAPAAVLAAPTLAPTPSAAAPGANAGDKRITITFKGKSWTEVRSKGEVIFSETAQPGNREFSGALPLSFIVGNASNVTIAIDGKNFDMSELTRNDVARFRVE